MGDCNDCNEHHHAFDMNNPKSGMIGWLSLYVAGGVGGYYGYQRYLGTLPQLVEDELENRKEREIILEKFNRERREKRERIRQEAKLAQEAAQLQTLANKKQKADPAPSAPASE